MKFNLFCFILFLLPAFLFPESRNSLKEKKAIDLGIEILQDKKIKIILPNESGFRKDFYDINGNLLQSEFYDLEGKLFEYEKNITIEKRTYNSSGFLWHIHTFNLAKSLTSTLTILYDQNCIQMKKDDSCATEISITDASNHLIDNEEGISTYKTEFDSNCLKNTKKKASDCKKLELRLNKNHQLVEDKDGNAKVLRAFDLYGNITLYEIYNRVEKIMHKVVYAYNYKCIDLTNKPQGCIIFQQYTNQIEKTKNNKELINYGKKIVTYDLNCIKEKRNSEKCISSEENYDLNGKLQDISHRFTFGCLDYSLELGAYAKKISKFDKKGNEILREFYNAKNQLIEDSSGGAKYIYAYNQDCLDNGHKTQYCRTLTEIYDKDLKLKYKAIYDENCVKTGKAIIEEPNYCTAWKESYRTVKSKGKTKNKIRIIKADFDKNGFKTSMEKFNIHKKLRLRTVYFFDKEKLIRKENQDVNGNLIEDSGGIASYIYQYGVEKYSIKEESLDKKGKLKANKEGIARMIFSYDENCLNRKSNRYDCTNLEEFYDEKGNLIELMANIENTHSYAKMIRKFNNDGNRIMEAYFDKDNKPKKNQTGIAKYKFFYDNTGEISEEEFYNEKDTIKLKIKYAYDTECKNLSKDFSCNTSIAFFNKKNQLIDKEKLDGIPYAKEFTSYNYSCIKITSDPDECLEKKEFINAKKEIIYSEYFQYIKPPSIDSEIKLIKLKMTNDKTPYSVEFIK